MKNLINSSIYIFCLICCSCSLTAQSTTDVLAKFNQIYQGELTVKNGQYHIIPSESGIGQKSRLDIKEVQINQNNLIVNYEIAPLSRLERDMEYQLKMHISFNNFPEIEAYQEKVKGIQSINLGNMVSDYYSLRWEDVIQATEFNLGDFQLNLTADLVGLPPFDCAEDIPNFSKKQKRIYWVTALGSLGLITTGVILDLNGQSQHDQYVQEVFRGVSPNTTESSYSRANLSNETATLLYITGGSILLIDGLLYRLRSKNTKNKAEAFKDYCKNYSFTMGPFLDQSSEGTLQNGVFAKLTLKF